MSAMLDSYDMQILDYTGDLDIQMHPSSDQWLLDESKMEEDGPPGQRLDTKTDSLLSMKPESPLQDASEVSIEVDMEPYADEADVEYEMLDDETQELGPEIFDVEVYDASLAQSPALPTSEFQDVEAPEGIIPGEQVALDPSSSVTHGPSSPTGFAQDVQDTYETPTEEALNELESTEFHVLPEHIDPDHQDDQPDAGSDDKGPAVSSANVGSDGIPQNNTEANEQDTREGSWGERATETDILEPKPNGAELEGFVAPTTSTLSAEFEDELVDDENNTPAPQNPARFESTHASPTSSAGDPHEISEGVYIDPPPPVLLSISMGDKFNFTLFNEPSSWRTQSRDGEENEQATSVVLEQSPTLYYEPLATVFEALRREEVVISLPNIAEAELVMQAVDLHLTISEDNIHTREISLHDLNALHDSCGLEGLLRIQLFTAEPRFMVRYQALQEHITRLHADQPEGDVEKEVNEEISQQAVSAESLGEAESSEALGADSSALRSELLGAANDNTLSTQPPLAQTSSDLQDQGVDATAGSPVNPEDFGEENNSNEDTEEISKESVKANDSQEDQENTCTVSDRDSTTTLSDSCGGEIEILRDGDEGNVVSLEDVEAQFDQEESPVAEEVHNDTVSDALLSREDSEDKESSSSTDPAAETLEILDPNHPEITLPASSGVVEVAALATRQPEGRVSCQENQISGFFNIEGDQGSPEIELPSEPIEFEGGEWDDELDGEGELDITWDYEKEKPPSNDPAHTLSSKSSKRSFDQVDFLEPNDVEDAGGNWSHPSSPDTKRSRIC